jgi:DNA-directed RNA polymerase specialized sigma subunit
MTKNEIIISMYQSDIILRYCRTIHPEYDELKSQLIIQLIKMPDIKLITAEQRGYLEYLCFVICKRIVAGRVKDSGMFYLAKNHLSIQEGWGLDKAEEPDENVDNDKIDKINGIVDNLHWYNKTLFNYHYKDGYKLREIAEMTGINLKSIAYTIKKTREEIKKKL